MTACRPGGELVEVDVEERVDLHAVGADVDQADPESVRVVEGGEERVGDVHPTAVAGDVHHVGLDAGRDGAEESGAVWVGDVPLLEQVVAEATDEEVAVVGTLAEV